MSKFTETQKERIRAVINALRSGKYKKTTGQLKEDDCFCALGIFCEVYRLRRKDGSRWNKDHFYVGTPNKDYSGGAYLTLPKKLEIYFGFEDNRIPDQISNLNDTKGWKFPTIANWLEKLIA